MRKAGVNDYEAFARKVLGSDPRPAGFVRGLCRRFREHGRAGAHDRGLGPNVNVKIPVTNTKGQSAGELIRALSAEGVVLNVTAIFTLDQVRAVADALDPTTPAIVSVFAGRIADTGVDPVPHMLACKQILGSRPKAELLWASPRELLNIFHAEESGCDIITVPNEFLNKLDLVGKDLAEYSRETVQMFYRDATAAAYQINDRPASRRSDRRGRPRMERLFDKVLVTGGAGYCGARLVPQLLRAATKSRSTTSCSSATTSCRTTIPICGSSTATSATPQVRGGGRRP